MKRTSFQTIPSILTSQELLDKAFSRAAKIDIPWRGSWISTVREQVVSKISTVESIETSFLKKVVRKFPSVDEMHPFHRNFLNLVFSIDSYKISLAKMQKTSQKIVELSSYSIGRVKKSDKVQVMNRYLKEFYGRTSSLIADISHDLEFLSRCRDEMKMLPVIDPYMPTFIIAGMPNAGKSSLVSYLTNSRTKIATYPFTTKTVILGIAEFSGKRYQILDIPGLLDRRKEERNDMEMKAILALRFIEGKIIFLLDYSYEAFAPIDVQKRLLSEMKDTFGKDVIAVQSKIDISERMEDLCISIKTGDGINNLIDIMVSNSVKKING
ncbi:MAG: 50S ribosome-binding GTPase [Candidatus Thermoplasmatota archaeon]|nr:50S ribosome-binding GTPase [Candidatus Thermoplasmatota archaeon]